MFTNVNAIPQSKSFPNFRIAHLSPLSKERNQSGHWGGDWGSNWRGDWLGLLVPTWSRSRPTAIQLRTDLWHI